MDLSNPIPFSVIVETIVVIVVLSLIGVWLVNSRKG